MNNSHIVSTYDEDLNLLKTNLTELGLKVEKQIFNYSQRISHIK